MLPDLHRGGGKSAAPQPDDVQYFSIITAAWKLFVLKPAGQSGYFLDRVTVMHNLSCCRRVPVTCDYS
jgi:hypothetical protein